MYFTTILKLLIIKNLLACLWNYKHRCTILFHDSLQPLAMQWCQKQWDRQSTEALLVNSIANPALLNSPFWFIEEGSSSNISTSRPMLGRELPLHALAIQKEEKHLIWSMSWHAQGVVHWWARSGWGFTAPVCLFVQLSRLSPAHSSKP